MRLAELSQFRRLLILAICCLSLLLVGLDITIVNVGLPSIRRELHTTISGLQWVVASYTLVVAGLLMLSGSTADRIGRKRMFLTGLVIFMFGSLLCSLAPNLGLLVAFRMVQAVGGSMLNPVALSIITNVFTDRAERARAIGLWGGVFGLSLALGPVIGGLLVTAVGWRGIFWVNLPVGAVAIGLTLRYVPESKAATPGPIDLPGQALVAAALAALVFAVIEAPGRGWTAPPVIASFVIAVCAAVALIGYESRRDDPLLDLRFFHSVPFSGALVIAVCAFAALGGYLLLLTIYLQDVRDYAPLRAGLTILPMAVPAAICAPLSGRIVAARGARLPLLVAGTCITAGALVLTGLSGQSSPLLIAGSLLLFGIGFGSVSAPVSVTAVSGMPAAHAGTAAALASIGRQVGMSLGVAVIGSAVTSVLAGPIRAGFTPASHIGWWLVAGCGLAVLVAGLLSTGSRAKRTAEAVSDLISAQAAR